MPFVRAIDKDGLTVECPCNRHGFWMDEDFFSFIWSHQPCKIIAGYYPSEIIEKELPFEDVPYIYPVNPFRNEYDSL